MSIQLLGDACSAFNDNCAVGILPNEERIQANLDTNLMQVTALNRHIGYDRAAAIAKYAHKNGLSLREAATGYGEVADEDFTNWVKPIEMTRPS